MERLPFQVIAFVTTKSLEPKSNKTLSLWQKSNWKGIILRLQTTLNNGWTYSSQATHLSFMPWPWNGFQEHATHHRNTTIFGRSRRRLHPSSSLTTCRRNRPPKFSLWKFFHAHLSCLCNNFDNSCLCNNSDNRTRNDIFLQLKGSAC